VIRETAGFFVYDPQTGAAFDPVRTEFRDHTEYDRVSEQLPEIVAKTLPTCWNRYLTALLLLLLLMVGVFAHSHLKSAPLNGWWIKEAGAPHFPEQMSITLERDRVMVRYPDSGGVTTLTLLADGHPHAWRAISNPILGGVAAYSAELKGSSLFVRDGDEKNTSQSPEERWTQQWRVDPTRNQLTLTSTGEEDAVFRRASITRRLFESAP